MPSKKDFRKPDEPVYITEGGLRALEKRLITLKASLPHLIEDASLAAADGDRSDNDAYKQAKGLLRRTHRQIWDIEDQLKRTSVIKPGRNDSGTVQIGSRVTIETQSGERSTFEVVGAREANPSHGRISNESPLGRALLGHAESETVSMETPNGLRKYLIIKIQ